MRTSALRTTGVRRWRSRALPFVALSLAWACADDPTRSVPQPASITPTLDVSLSSSNFQQCANGNNGGEPCFWINGVLNASKSRYSEGEAIAERLVLNGLNPGDTYTLVIDWGWQKAKAPAHMNYDFWAGWDVTLGGLANVCGDPLGNGASDIRKVCSGNALRDTHDGDNHKSANIPPSVFFNGAPRGLKEELEVAIERFLTIHGPDAVRMDIFGGSFPANPFVDATYTIGGDDVTGRMTVRFTAGHEFVLLAWGGHFADELDYKGKPWEGIAGSMEITGAAGQDGAPFHYSMVSITDANGVTTGIGNLSNNVVGAAVERVPSAQISITPTATNGIGEPHTFVAKLEKNLDDGLGFKPAAGEHVDVTLTPAAGAVLSLDAAASTCDNTGANTDANGECRMVFTSSAAGTVTGHASASLTVGTTPLTVATGGVGGATGNAVKTFVAGTLGWLKHDGSNTLLGGATFTVCRTHNWVTATASYGDITPDVCVDVTDGAAPDVDADAGEFQMTGLILGRYTVVEKAAPSGYSKDPDTETADLDTTTPSATITTAFVNVQPGARIAIAEGATNGIGEPHTFTVTLEKDPGAGGFVAAAGEHVDVTLTPSGGASVQLDAAASTCDDAGANTDASGQCTVTFTSPSAGAITGHASASLVIGGVNVSVQTNGVGDNSDDAVKAFVAGAIRWLKKDGLGAFLGGAVFTVCRTHDWDSDLSEGGGYTDIEPDVCVDVTDNVSGTDNSNAPPADRDGTAGEFQLGGLILGKYTVEEKTAPAGYILDPDTETAELSTTSTSATIATAFVNISPDAFITISPESETNSVSAPHTFTAVMTVIPNGGSPVAIPDFTISVSPTPSTPGTTACGPYDAATFSKRCTLEINSNVAGTFTANASATATVGAISLTRDTDPTTEEMPAGPDGSGPATKIYVAPNLTITKTPDQMGDPGYLVQPNGTATFTITVKNTGLGAAFNTVIKDTLPNSGLDWSESNGSCSIATIDADPDAPVETREELTCTLGTLDPNEEFTVAVSTTVPTSYIQVQPSDAGTPLQIDGNLIDDGEGNDWANVGIVCQTAGCRIDDPSGQQDGAFGQGTSEDSPVPSIVDGGVPPEKSDLLRFYIATERFVTSDYLYLAWERVQEPNGTTNMDFELNQSTTLSSNNVTPVRTAGDILVKYDLAKGGDTPVLGFHRWVTQASAGGQPAAQACEATNKFPCWGRRQLLSNDVAGAINAVSVTDPINPGAPRSLDARTFGEARINLQASGIFQPGVCLNFGRAYLKSRSSDSFTAALKDFIAPVPISINTCEDVFIENTAWVSASNFTPTSGPFSGVLGGGIFNDGQIKVQAPQTGSALRLGTLTGERFALSGPRAERATPVDGEATVVTGAVEATPRLRPQPELGASRVAPAVRASRSVPVGIRAAERRAA